MIHRRFLSALAVLLFACSSAAAAPVSSNQASDAVKGWLASNSAPFGGVAGDVSVTESFGENGKVSSTEDALYHVVYLEPQGIVIMPADDLIEPITAYLPAASLYAPGENPVYKVVASNIVKHVKSIKSAGREAGGDKTASPAQEKWARLIENASLDGAAARSGREQISDIRVQPLLMTRWNQMAVGPDPEFYVFNYYTPNHYASGCTATAMSQTMYFFRHPRTGIGVKTFDIKVDGSLSVAATRGGDGVGGPYKWDLMPTSPDASASVQVREAIGALLYDTGVSINSEYEESGTASLEYLVAKQLVETFGYSNAVCASINGAQGGVRTDLLRIAMNSNLDAGLPTALGIIAESGGGHSVVADGYGFDGGTMYHHINMGWSGADDVWYAIPEIGDYNVVDEVVFNVYTDGSGEIVSGRVLTSRDLPVAGAKVTIKGAGTDLTTNTNDKGIFAFSKLPSNTNFRIEAERSGFTFGAVSVSTGKSETVAYDAPTPNIGNIWDVQVRESVRTGGGGGGGGCDVAYFIFLLPVAAGIMTLKRRGG